MGTVKILSNWLKTRADNVGATRMKGGGDGDIDVGMLSSDAWTNDTRTVYIGSFYWP